MSDSPATPGVPPTATVGADVAEQRVTTPEASAPAAPKGPHQVVFRASNLDFYYGNAMALKGVNMDIHRNEITALIGPSGCGKSTFLRCLNRMNDLIPGARVDGDIEFHGQNLYASDIDAVDVRRRIGMVFQKPNPFPKSIKDNLAVRDEGQRHEGQRRARRGRAAPGGAVGRGEGQAQPGRLRPVGRPAAAPVHRARHRGGARGDPDGRALLGPGPHLDAGASRT